MTSSKATSERLQLKKIREHNPEDFKKQDHCILLFLDDFGYSLVERKTIDENAQVKSVVEVKIKGEKYKATVLFIGSRDECVKRIAVLDANWDQDDLDNAAAGSTPATTQTCTKITKRDDPIGNNIGSELKKVQKPASSIEDTEELGDNSDESALEEIKPVKMAARTTPTSERPLNDTWREDIDFKLDRIMSKVISIEQLLSSRSERVPITPPSSKKMKRDDLDQGDPSSSFPAPPAIMYNDTNLLSLPSGGDIKNTCIKCLHSSLPPRKWSQE